MLTEWLRLQYQAYHMEHVITMCFDYFFHKFDLVVSLNRAAVQFINKQAHCLL